MSAVLERQYPDIASFVLNPGLERMRPRHVRRRRDDVLRMEVAVAVGHLRTAARGVGERDENRIPLGDVGRQYLRLIR